MNNKSNELIADIELINNKLHFKGIVDGNEPISIDYIPPLGDNLGYTSLELFLLSFTSCLGSAVLTFLRKMNKQIQTFEMNAIGYRKQNHPSCFNKIIIQINLKSGEVSEDDLNKVVKLAEDTYCPVWAMIKGNVEVIVNYSIK